MILGKSIGDSMLKIFLTKLGQQLIIYLITLKLSMIVEELQCAVYEGHSESNYTLFSQHLVTLALRGKYKYKYATESYTSVRKNLHVERMIGVRIIVRESSRVCKKKCPLVRLWGI